MLARWYWIALLAISCKEPRPATHDAMPDTPGERTFYVERATAPAQPGLSLHTGDGAIWVRASTGVFRSAYEGEQWTKVIDGATSAIEIGGDTVIATRVTGGAGNEIVTVERHANGSTTTLSVPASFPPGGRWIAAAAELDGDQLYLRLTGRADATTPAPASSS